MLSRSLDTARGASRIDGLVDVARVVVSRIYTPLFVDFVLYIFFSPRHVSFTNFKNTRVYVWCDEVELDRSGRCVCVMTDDVR